MCNAHLPGHCGSQHLASAVAVQGMLVLVTNVLDDSLHHPCTSRHPIISPLRWYAK